MNFYTKEFQETISNLLNLEVNDNLSLLIPLGVSFYTFQKMGYLIDVYKKRIDAEKNLINFSLFIVFFPQLIAGPIERAKNLLTQIKSDRRIDFESILNGIGLITFGYFQKVVIADNLAPFYIELMGSPKIQNTYVAFLTIYMGVLRVYCDFSGYSKIARGTASMLGFELSENFKNPLFSTGAADMWRRWHITLVEWFKLYLFAPLLGFLRKKTSKNVAIVISLLVTTTAIGLWHGISLNFLLWGLLNGLSYIIYHLLNSKNVFSSFKIPNFLKTLIWFHIWGLFGYAYASRGIEDLPLHVQNFFQGPGPVPLDLLLTIVIFGGILLFFEYLHEKDNSPFFLKKRSLSFRLTSIAILYFLILFCGTINESKFVYFQF